MVAHRWLLPLLLSVACPQAAPAQDPPPPPAETPEAERPTLDGLLARFAAMKGLFTRFREEKHMALLAAPLVNEGTLHYAPPGRVARHVLEPAPQTVLIDGTSITMGDGRRTETVKLSSNPVLKEFLDSFLLVLEGDRAALETAYLVGFEPGKPGQPWSLSLRPRRSPMKEAIVEIAFVGRGIAMERMTILEVGGDKTLTTFSQADPEKVYTEQELKRVFRLPTRKAGGK